MPKKKLRTLIYLVLNFVIVFSVYQLLLRMQWTWGMIVYLLAAAALTVGYFVMNRGFGNPITDPAALPEAWSAAEKTEYIARVTACHERAKKLLYWLLPVVLTLMIDVIELFLSDTLRALFGG